MQTRHRRQSETAVRSGLHRHPSARCPPAEWPITTCAWQSAPIGHLAREAESARFAYIERARPTPAGLTDTPVLDVGGANRRRSVRAEWPSWTRSYRARQNPPCIMIASGRALVQQRAGELHELALAASPYQRRSSAGGGISTSTRGSLTERSGRPPECAGSTRESARALPDPASFPDGCAPRRPRRLRR